MDSLEKGAMWLCISRQTYLLLAVGLLALPASAMGALTLDQAVELAHLNDPWLAGNEYRQRAMEAQSISAGSLPDPVVSVGLANLPTDTFDFNQEAMTQFTVGVSQLVPRGDSRALQQKQLQLMSSQHPHQRDDRRARVAVQVSELWLEAYRARQSIRLIEEDRGLFEHLVDVAQSSYSSAMGRTRQQDLVRAQLELTRLEDRLAQLREGFDTSRARLLAWLYPGQGLMAEGGGPAGTVYSLSPAMPEISLLNSHLYQAEHELPPQEVATYLRQHPAIRSLDSGIAASDTGIDLAEQRYRPQWRLSAGYGYRDDDPLGRERADFFSMGVAFDLPLFTSKRQDQQLHSAVASAEAARTEKSLALRNMVATFNSQRSRLLRLDQRRELYRSRLLEEMQEQAEASLSAYTNDDGDFSEVVRARIAELNARIDALDIDIERLKTISRLNYFFAPTGA